MVAIVILAIAIIPMVRMFDSGLKSVTTSSKYDQVRALANQNLEKVRALDYKSAVAQYPPGPTGRPCPVGTTELTYLTSCTVTTTYLNPNMAPDANAKDAMQIEVKVKWDETSYTTTGLKAQGLS